jgi:hypothetical protein
MLGDGSAIGAGEIDGREVAVEAVLGVAAGPLHAVATNAAATIEIARRRQGTGIRWG